MYGLYSRPFLLGVSVQTKLEEPVEVGFNAGLISWCFIMSLLKCDKLCPNWWRVLKQLFNCPFSHNKQLCKECMGMLMKMGKSATKHMYSSILNLRAQVA